MTCSEQLMTCSRVKRLWLHTVLTRTYHSHWSHQATTWGGGLGIRCHVMGGWLTGVGGIFSTSILPIISSAILLLTGTFLLLPWSASLCRQHLVGTDSWVGCNTENMKTSVSAKFGNTVQGNTGSLCKNILVTQVKKDLFSRRKIILSAELYSVSQGQ